MCTDTRVLKVKHAQTHVYVSTCQKYVVAGRGGSGAGAGGGGGGGGGGGVMVTVAFAHLGFSCFCLSCG